MVKHRTVGNKFRIGSCKCAQKNQQIFFIIEVAILLLTTKIIKRPIAIYLVYSEDFKFGQKKGCKLTRRRQQKSIIMTPSLNG